VADDDRNYVNANSAALELLGHDLSTLRTMRIDDITIPEYRPFLDDVWAEFLSRGGTIGRFSVLRSDGSPVDIGFNATANVASGLHLSIFINPSVTGAAEGLDEDEIANKNFEEPVRVVADAGSAPVLDADEPRVMSLLALGLNWHEVAEKVGTTAGEVRRIMGAAMQELGTRTRAHAVSIAMRVGEIDPDALAPETP